MSGYAWTPIVRLTPQNGLPREYDLTSALSWAGGPTATSLSWDQESLERETINRRRRDCVLGWRPVVKLTVQIGGDMLDDDVVADIQSAFARGEIVELALDGLTYRRVRLEKVKGPEPLAKRTYIGAEYELEFVGDELVTDRQPISYGRW